MIAALLIYGGIFAWQEFAPHQVSGTPFATATVNELAVNLVSPEGQLQKGDNKILIEFRDSSGQLVDVGDVKFNLDMNMTGMVMHSGATIERTSTPGQYRATIQVGMAGDWNARISFDGPRGQGQQSFSATAK